MAKWTATHQSKMSVISTKSFNRGPSGINQERRERSTEAEKLREIERREAAERDVTRRGSIRGWRSDD